MNRKNIKTERTARKTTTMKPRRITASAAKTAGKTVKEKNTAAKTAEVKEKAKKAAKKTAPAVKEKTKAKKTPAVTPKQKPVKAAKKTAPAEKVMSRKTAAKKTPAVTAKQKPVKAAKKTAPAVKDTVKKKTALPVKEKTKAKNILAEALKPIADDPMREPDAQELRREEYLLSQSDPAESEISSVDPDYEPDPVKRDALKSYMVQIAVFPRISVEDEVRLAKQIHGKNAAKGYQAEETLINANLRLVVKIAHDFKGMGLPLSDLISEGNLGLIRSARKFDPTKGAKFSSYAAWWIKQSMRRALWNQARVIRTPVQTGAKLHKVRRMRESLRQELGREPEIGELAAALNFSERTVTMLLHADNRVFSLQDSIKEGENDTFEELIEDPNAKSPELLCSDADSMQMLHQAVARLDPRERQVLIMRFYEGLTLEQASLLINRTRERVRQIQSQALRKLRSMMAEESEVVNS